MSDDNTTSLTPERFAEIKRQAAALTYEPTKRAAEELIAEIGRLRAELASREPVPHWAIDWPAEATNDGE